MWSDKQFEELEESERKLTLEEIAIMLLLLGNTKSNIESELMRFYKKYGTDGIVTYNDARKWVSSEDRRRRLTVLLLFLSNEFVTLNSTLEVKFFDLESKILKSEFDFFDIEIKEDLSLWAWGYDDLTWQNRLKNDVYLWNDYLGTDIKRSLIRGDSIDDVLIQVNKRFLSMENVLRRLGITESSAITAVARQEIFKELSIKKYRYYTRADERTCEICGSMHGLTFPISAYEIGVTAPPLHANCRCWTTPIME